MMPASTPENSGAFEAMRDAQAQRQRHQKDDHPCAKISRNGRRGEDF